MRTLSEIIEAARSNQGFTEDEARLALTVMDMLDTMTRRDFWKAAGVEHPLVKLDFDRRKRALGQAVDVWLGSDSDPRDPAVQRRRRISIRLLDKVAAAPAAPVFHGDYRNTTACRADSDGECHWPECPQIRDGEPGKSGRHCPLDVAAAPDAESNKEV